MHVDLGAGRRGSLSPRILSAALFCVVAAAHASGIDQLRSFVSGAKSGKATFRQVVTSQRGTTETTGTFTFQRPGKFRWVYQKPYEQLIVGDGDKLWIYDRDLNQVIVRKLDSALGSSPAALLSGDNALERNFELADAGKTDGAEWVDAKPKAADTGFERVRIGFKNNLPRVMELKDTFGNVTRLEFGTFERNATLDAGQFKFVPPKGADVVGATD
jgi:outer membrane lipoprotein carrier protein